MSFHEFAELWRSHTPESDPLYLKDWHFVSEFSWYEVRAMSYLLSIQEALNLPFTCIVSVDKSAHYPTVLWGALWKSQYSQTEMTLCRLIHALNTSQMIGSMTTLTCAKRRLLPALLNKKWETSQPQIIVLSTWVARCECLLRVIHKSCSYCLHTLLRCILHFLETLHFGKFFLGQMVCF